MKGKPLLVVGAQRSGTTLLNRVLNSHPEIALLYQQSNFLRLDIADLRGLDVRELVTRARKADSLYSRRFSDEVEKQVLASLSDTSNAEVVFEAMVRILTGDGQSKYYGEKYAGRCIEALRFLDLTATGPIIHIVRDPRDVCASERRRQEAEKTLVDGRPYFLMLEDWKVGLYIGEHLSRVFPERYFRLRYEDLVSDPERTARRICTFLDLPYAPQMLDASTFTDDDAQPWAANSYFNFDVTKLSDFRGRWRESLPTDEALFVEWYCADGMKTMGYRREATKLWHRVLGEKRFSEMKQQTETVARKYINSAGYRAYSPASVSEPIDLVNASPTYRPTPKPL